MTPAQTKAIEELLARGFVRVPRLPELDTDKVMMWKPGVEKLVVRADGGVLSANQHPSGEAPEGKVLYTKVSRATYTEFEVSAKEQGLTKSALLRALVLKYILESR